MEIIQKKVEELILYKNNPRNNDAAVDAVANSIREFGFKVPIIVDNNNVIVAGHTRLKAAEQLGLGTVPCIIADNLTPEQVKAFRLADNKTAELADWDFAALEQELDEIGDEFDMSDFGFETMGEDYAAEAPDSFDEIDELETKNKCPKCGYEW